MRRVQGGWIFGLDYLDNIEMAETLIRMVDAHLWVVKVKKHGKNDYNKQWHKELLETYIQDSGVYIHQKRIVKSYLKKLLKLYG